MDYRWVITGGLQNTWINGGYFPDPLTPHKYIIVWEERGGGGGGLGSRVSDWRCLL